ncbi:uncharacterized protein SCHCODRAFT_01055517, partial [Schizophyllum commune H4-8]|uniref:uncharacterized protein n=1 Tax=Schizophyllum commune (strain H4-8 / FGSC 9210) TaxID=578458 RepID=UPI00215DE414
LTQLRTGHAGLNANLNRIGLSPTPSCPHCGMRETITHYVLRCPQYRSLRAVLLQETRLANPQLRYLLSVRSRKNVPALLRYVKATGRFA